MEVGKTILGMQALEIVCNTSDNPGELKKTLAQLIMQQMDQAVKERGVKMGFAPRGMYVKDMDFVGRPGLSGYLLDVRIGPEIPVDDESLYRYLHFFAELDTHDRFVELHAINNYDQAL